jgi:hypothetical protein
MWDSVVMKMRPGIPAIGLVAGFVGILVFLIGYSNAGQYLNDPLLFRTYTDMMSLGFCVSLAGFIMTLCAPVVRRRKAWRTGPLWKVDRLGDYYDRAWSKLKGRLSIPKLPPRRLGTYLGRHWKASFLAGLALVFSSVLFLGGSPQQDIVLTLVSAVVTAAIVLVSSEILLRRRSRISGRRRRGSLLP